MYQKTLSSKTGSHSVRLILILIICTGFFSCLGRGYLKAPTQKTKVMQNRLMLMGLKLYGRNGDWILMRGYSQMADLIADATGGVFSHVALLDKEQNQVIESDRSGVHATPLKDFTDESYRMVVVRPKWRTSKQIGKLAIDAARKQIGKPYDLIGLIGIHIADSYYCSELAIKVYQPFMKKEDKIPNVVVPMALLNWGRIIYDSGTRDVLGDSIRTIELDNEGVEP